MFYFYLFWFLLGCAMATWVIFGNLPKQQPEPANALDQLIAAMIVVESQGDDLAYNPREQAFGCLQIRKAAVDDYNKKNPDDPFYFPEECYERESSIHLCKWYVQFYGTARRLGREPTLEDFARIWVGGPDGYRQRETLTYWGKVKLQLKRMNP